MAIETRAYVISLLESYHKRMNQIALLHYELEHPANVSSDEMIETMSLSRSDGASRSKGHVSNKTLYIALNYHEKAESLNLNTVDEISSQLVELEQIQARLDHCISLLDKRQKKLVQALYTDRLSMKETEKMLGRSAKTVRKLRDDTVDTLAKMYDFVKDKRR